MRTIVLAAALSISGMAVAQTTTEPAAPAETTTSSPDGVDPNARGVPPGDGITQQGTNPEGQAVAPPGANQVTAVVPGATVVPAANQEAVFAPKPATEEYPACSKTVTDKCVQKYERGVR